MGKKDGKKCRVGKDGTLQTGWFKAKGKKYYADASGNKMGVPYIGVQQIKKRKSMFLIQAVFSEKAGPSMAAANIMQTQRAKSPEALKRLTEKRTFSMITAPCIPDGCTIMVSTII